jgi:hypothetical protein
MRSFLLWGESLGRPECPYIRRWVVGLRNRKGQMSASLHLHHWIGSDDPRAFHDHPGWFIVLVLRHGYVDVSPASKEPMPPGTIRFRQATHRHTVVVGPAGCWTLCLFGPRTRDWGFWVRKKNGTERLMRSNKWFLTHGHHPCASENVKKKEAAGAKSA